MRKIVVIIVFVLYGVSISAQEKGSRTDKGLIEVNTNFGAFARASTSIEYLSFSGGDYSLNIGGEGGYFVIKNLAVKLGLGYGYSKQSFSLRDTSTFSYKIGAKYYFFNKIPVQVDYTGAKLNFLDESLNYIGIQGGYAIFLAKNVSVEPGMHYSISLDDNIDTLQLNIGFVLHF